MTVSDTLWKSWSVQRILNRYPIWTRARTRDDAVAHYILNPFGNYLDEVLENLLKIKRNYYVGKADVLEQPFIYSLDLPNTFEFVTEGSVQGTLTLAAPAVTATLDSTSISVEVVDEPKLQNIEKTAVVPTRIDLTHLFNGFSDAVIPETSIVDLESVTVNDAFVSELGHVYIEIDDGTQFGETFDDGTIIVPKVVVKGIPWIEDDPKEEHVTFRSNGERKSIDRWDEIDTIETQGIYDSTATIRVHSGFEKRALREPIAFWEDELHETLLLYTYENNLFSGSNLPTIQFKVPEITNIDLRAQGFSTDTLEYEFGVMVDSSTFLSDTLVGFERMPFTRWFTLATKNDLHIVSARIPHLFNWISTDDNDTNIVAVGLKARSVSPELNILAERNWMNYSEDGGSILLETRHTKPVRGIKSTRLSITYDSPALSAPVTKYYDWDASEIDITTHFTQGFIFNSSSSAAPNDWDEKHLTIDVGAITLHPAWVAVVKLEAKHTDNNTETDVYIVHSDVRTIEKTLAWPAAIRGKVDGLTYDAKGRLLARTTDDQVWVVNMYWDYCLIDFKRGTVFLREEYNSVEVVS